MKKTRSLPEAPSIASEIKAAAAARKPPGSARRRAPSRVSPDDPAVAAAAASRAEAFDAVYTLDDKPLLPFTISRSSLFYKLRAADDAPPIGQVRRNPSAFLGDALRILFLCSHEPEILDRLRGNNITFLRAIDTWSEENISRKQEPEVINLGLKILNDSDVTRAEPASSGRRHLGE